MISIIYVIVALLFTITNCYGVHNSNKFIDLSHAFNNETMNLPGRTSTFYTESEGFTPGGFWVASRGFCTSEHTSTHIDAPYHVSENGHKLHEIPLENLIEVPGVMIDVYDKVHKFNDGVLTVIENYVLTREDILDWEQKHGTIPQGSVVLLRTGWESRWGNLNLYMGDNNTYENIEARKGGIDLMAIKTNANFPGFDASAAKYLSVERQVLGVGIDTFSVDPGNSKIFPAHRIFGSRNIYMLEMVANLHSLPPRGFDLWIVPFKIDFGTGAPVRVLARLTKGFKYQKS